MSRWSHEPRFSGDSVRVPKIWIAIALSLLVHATAIWQLKRELRVPSDDQPERGRSKGELTVQLAPRPSPPAAPRRPSAPPLKMFEKPRPPAPPAQAARKRAPPPRPTPPVIARSTPDALQAPPPKPSVPRPTPPSPQEDFAAALEARRSARSESPAAVQESAPAPLATEDANARANRLAAANLGTNNKPTFGADPRRGGGVFDIQHKGYDYAEFLFYGWNKDIRRNTSQVIEVRKAGHSTIELAIVRRMIAIIRDHEQGDFLWQSPRSGRNITLSARARDNAGLEAFMLREFFEIEQQR
ncbi:MAG: hypothetical protein V4637_03445 [Pseudomonadota bacterium]